MSLREDLAAEPEAWRRDAACREASVDFFDERIGAVEAAKATCRRCLVQAECLTFALENGETFGVWGGADPKERRQLVKVKRKPYRRR